MNISISRWWAPVIGAFIGYCVGSGARELGYDWTIATSIIGTVLGFICLFVAKANEKGAKKADIPVATHNRASVVGIILSICSLLLFFLPMGIGILISVAALAVNWKVKGTIKILAWIGLVLSIIFLVPYLAFIMNTDGK
jgi:hypothetical protein